jgi:DNA-binding protein H-NS
MATLQELIAQKEALELQIQEQRKSELADAVTSVKALIVEYGLTKADLFGSESASKKGKGISTKAKVAAKYRDHESGKEWSGRGISPKWLQGKDKAQFLIGA